MNLQHIDLRIAFSKFRCVNHKLPIEKGRFYGIAIDDNDRVCELCNTNKLGDEYHYIFNVAFLRLKERNLYH